MFYEENSFWNLYSSSSCDSDLQLCLPMLFKEIKYRSKGN